MNPNRWLLILWATVALLPVGPTPGWAAEADVYGPPPLPRDTVPRIVIDPAEIDWGAVVQGESPARTFEIRNEGTATLRLLQVKPGCGCATVETVDTVAPGESGPLRLQVDTTKLRGTVRKGATIHTNDPETPTIRVYLTGSVLSPVSCEPAEPSLSALAGDTDSLDLVLKPGLDKPFTIVEVRTQFGNLSVGEVEELGDSRFRVRLTMKPQARPRWKRETLKVKILMDGEKRQVPIPVSIEHRDRIEILPGKRVEFDASETAVLLDPVLLKEHGGQLVKDVTLRATAEGGTFHIEKIDLGKLPPDVVAADFETLEAGKSYRVRIRLKRFYTDRKFLSGKIRVITDLPGHPQRDLILMARFTRTPVTRPPGGSQNR